MPRGPFGCGGIALRLKVRLKYNLKGPGAADHHRGVGNLASFFLLHQSSVLVVGHFTSVGPQAGYAVGLSIVLPEKWHGWPGQASFRNGGVILFT